MAVCASWEQEMLDHRACTVDRFVLCDGAYSRFGYGGSRRPAAPRYAEIVASPVVAFTIRVVTWKPALDADGRSSAVAAGRTSNMGEGQRTPRVWTQLKACRRPMQSHLSEAAGASL